MTEEKNQQQIKHWTYKQNLHYYFFLILTSHEFNANNRSSRIFLKMSKFVNKDHQQCRTHHQKKLKQLKKYYGGSQLQLHNLYKFYYQNYKMRLIGQQHLRYELLCFLKQLRQKPGQQEMNLYNQYFDKVEQNLDRLQLERYCLTYDKTSVKCQTEESEIQKYLSLEKDNSDRKGSNISIYNQI